MILLALFVSFLKIGCLSFGGGYAAIPLISQQVVELNHWLALKEFTDLVTISQMTPGPIAINAATFVGLKIDGIVGALVATLGCIIPSCIIVSIVAYVYLKYRELAIVKNILKYLRPAVVALIAVSGLLIIQEALTSYNLKLQPIIFFVIAMWLLKIKKINPLLVMLLSGLLQLFLFYLVKI